MKNIMLTLGAVPFCLDVAAYESLSRRIVYNWNSNNRIANTTFAKTTGGPALQYTGPGEESIDIKGSIYPEYRGFEQATTVFRWLAAAGEPLPMIGFQHQQQTSFTEKVLGDINLPDVDSFNPLTTLPTGVPMGFWVIKAVNESNSEFATWGRPKKIDFDMSLQRYITDNGVINALSL